MTGHQPNPSQEIAIENVVRGLGVKNVAVVDPKNIKELSFLIKDYLEKDEISVIVSKRICALFERRFNKQKNAQK